MEKGKLYISNTTETIIQCKEVFEGDYFAGYVVKEGIDKPFRLGLFSDSWVKENFTEYVKPATSTQIGGDHYNKKNIQPIDYILANELNFCEGNVIKYITRYKDKNGVEDLKKAKQYIDFLIKEYESKENI